MVLLIIVGVFGDSDDPDSEVLSTLKNGPWLERNEPELATMIISLPWVKDGIKVSEREAAQELVRLATFGQDAFRVIADNSWVADGLTPDETFVIRGLGYITQDSGDLATTIAEFAWMADGIEETEAAVVLDLGVIAQKHAAEALRIARMPFLTRLGPADIEAMDSLAGLSFFKGVVFKRIMAHSTIKAGISDDWAKIVALLYGVAETNPHLIDALLDPNQVTMEERHVVILPSGSVTLAIIRIGGGAERSMDLLEHAVRGVSSYMDAPFPTRYVALLFADAVIVGSLATNFGTHIAVLPEMDVDDDGFYAQKTGLVITHEVAHYYWLNGLSWVDEGVSEFLAITVENARAGRPLEPYNQPCGYATNIAKLESLGAKMTDGVNSAFGCNYSLGERFFIDLHQGIGDAAFRRGLKSLYMASELEDGDESTPGTAVGITHVREAFGTSAAGSAIMNRWYEGDGSYDKSRLDKGTVDAALPSVNGSIDLVGTALSSEDCKANRWGRIFSRSAITGWVWVCLKYSYDVDSGPVEAPIELVVFYEDGFAFERRDFAITAEARYIGGSRWLSVGPEAPDPWALGRYYVYIYHEGKKVGETEFIVLR